MKAKYEDRSKVKGIYVGFRVDMVRHNKMMIEMNGKKIKVGEYMRRLIDEHFDHVKKRK